MEELSDFYYVLISPESMIEMFHTDLEFEIWCESLETDNLKENLKQFEDVEMYEYCAIIKNVLDDRLH